MTNPEQITVKDFLAHRIENPQTIVIDVRDDENWEEGHIPGAIHIHKTKITEEIAAKVSDKNAEIICHCGGGQSGPRAAEELREMGYVNAIALQGGFRSYKAGGGKIEN